MLQKSIPVLCSMHIFAAIWGAVADLRRELICISKEALRPETTPPQTLRAGSRSYL